MNHLFNRFDVQDSSKAFPARCTKQAVESLVTTLSHQIEGPVQWSFSRICLSGTPETIVIFIFIQSQYFVTNQIIAKVWVFESKISTGNAFYQFLFSSPSKISFWFKSINERMTPFPGGEIKKLYFMNLALFYGRISTKRKWRVHSVFS